MLKQAKRNGAMAGSLQGRLEDRMVTRLSGKERVKSMHVQEVLFVGWRADYGAKKRWRVPAGATGYWVFGTV